MTTSIHVTKERSPGLVERLAMRDRPAGSPLMLQSWGNLLFMHWAIPVEKLRPLVPNRLSIDTFDGKAWIALAPFNLWNVRPRLLPPLPGSGRFNEINVRTYVHLDGAPGVWFFSLDASSALAVAGARAFFHLPYFLARIRSERQDGRILYASRRRSARQKAELNVLWSRGAQRKAAEPGSLDFFLVERYCLYAHHRGHLYRCRIFHRPWPLQSAVLSHHDSTLLEAAGLPTPVGEPLLHGAGPVDVEVWPLKEV